MKLFSWKNYLHTSTNAREHSVLFEKDEKLLLHLVQFDQNGPSFINTDKKFRMLIDCDSCLDRLYGGFYPDFQSGGQWSALHIFYEELKRSCEAHNIEIIFYINGTNPDDANSHEWLQKQSRYNWKVKNIYDKFEPNKKAAPHFFIPPSFLTEFIRSVAKSNVSSNKTFYAFQSTHDHAKECIDFCEQYECDALLTVDLDIITLFLIHQNLSNDSPRLKNTSLYEASGFKLTSEKKISIYRYNLNVFYDVFDLTTEQFAWFNILLGTNFFPSSWLKKFYYAKTGIDFKNGIRNSKEAKEFNLSFFQSLMGYVKSCKAPISETLSEDIYFQTCPLADAHMKKLGFQKSKEYFFSEFINRRLIYRMLLTEEVNEQSLLESVKEYDNLFQKLMVLSANCAISSTIYQVYSNRTYYLSTAIEPLNEEKNLRMEQIFRPIREYMYTLIFSGDQNHVEVNEIAFEPGTEKKIIIPIKVTPLMSNLDLEAIWKQTKKQRISHFLKSVKSYMIYEMIIPAEKYSPNEFIYRDYLIPCCVLRYLIQSFGLLSDQDIEAFLYTFVYINSTPPCRFRNTIYKDQKGMHLANLFLKGMEHFSLANDVCGKPIDEKSFLIWKFFNGIFFQLSYYNCISNNKEFIKNHFTDEIALLQLLNTIDKLKRFVYYGLESYIQNTRQKYSQIYNRNNSELERDIFPVDEHLEMPTNIALIHDSQIKSRIFETDRQHQRYLANKISPKITSKATFIGRGKSFDYDEPNVQPLRRYRNNLDNDKYYSMQPSPRFDSFYSPRNNDKQLNQNRSNKNLNRHRSLDASSFLQMNSQNNRRHDFKRDNSRRDENNNNINNNNNKNSDCIDYANMNFLNDFKSAKYANKELESIKNLTIEEKPASRPRIRCSIAEKIEEKRN